MRASRQRLPADLVSVLGSEPSIASGPELVAGVSADQMPALTERLRKESEAVFVDLFGIDRRSRGQGFELHAVFALDQAGTWLHLVAHLPEGSAQYPSLTPLLPAADWYEREVWDEVGLEARGHPAMARLRLPSDWPDGVRPLSHTFSCSAEMPRKGGDVMPKLAAAPAGVVDYPLGPVRSGVVESVHYGLRTVGEELVDVRLRPFYKHRGMEKMAENLPAIHLPLLAERISGTSAFAHSLALCQALEAAVGVEAPPRALYLRTMLAEIERLYNHLGYQADLCQATGLVVGQAQMDILKERVLRLNAVIAGHRYLFGMNVAGGAGP